MTETIILSAILQLTVSLYVINKGRKNFSYLLFFLLSIATLCWAVLNYISIIFGDSTLLIYIVRAIMFFATVQVYFFYLFTHTFPLSAFKNPFLEQPIYSLISLATAALTLTPFLFESITLASGHPNITTGTGMIIFICYVIFSITVSFKVLIKKFRSSVGLKRNQVLLLLAASVINWIIIPITNFGMTIVFKTLIFVSLSPLFSLIFSSIIAHALVRHRLFDAQTVLRSSTIYVSYYLRNHKYRSIEYYELQSQVYLANSNHVALDFSGVKELDEEGINLLRYLKTYMESQGKKIYFIRYTKKIFDQLGLRQ